MRWPELDAWVFSIKTFAGAMLALFIGFGIGLPRPYWAMATAYIVAQPLTGAMRSKGVFRVCGTVLGACGSLALVPNLANAPVLLCLALALWIGGCLFLSLLDRTPRSYVFMLAGYTAAIIGFPSVADPGAIFDTAVARTEEIILGILCTTVIGGVVLPRPVGPVLSLRIRAWLLDAARWSDEALSGQPADEARLAARRKLAGDMVEIDMLSTHLAYDISNQQRATQWVRALQARMASLLPVLASIADRLAALRQSGASPSPGVEKVLVALSGWIPAGPRDAARDLRKAIAELEPAIDAASGWREMMLSSLLLRLRELVDIWQDCRDLWRHIERGGGALPRRLAFRTEAALLRHRDPRMALLSGFAAAVAVLIVCAFWIGAAWDSGAVAAEMAGVACCIFAALDDPVPAILSFLFYAVVAIAIDAVYLFAVLPMVHDFVILALVLAPAFLFFGLLIANPATYGTGMALAANGATLMSLQDTYSADFAVFANNAIALVVGLATAAAVTRLIRSVGAEWSARRLMRAGWADLAEVASRPAGSREGARERARLAGLMLDRLIIAVPRLALSDAGADAAARAMMADVRVGLNILDVQRHRRTLPDEAQGSIDSLLQALARYFQGRARRGAMTASHPAPLLDRIDAALASIAASPPASRHRLSGLLLALVGIRRGLFPGAPDYRPPATDAAT
ncbi:MAG TPA: FUSC family protein [Acetobacteraceae bacterium]|nr:FUSC family protein [Acetobacteraceae bacterium]